MDPVTHMLTGACLGRAGLNRTTGYATLTMVLAMEAPDVDSFTYFGGSVFGLQHHRGITHSFAGAPLVACLVLAIVYAVHRLRTRRGLEPQAPPRWKLIYAYSVLGALLHLFQDFTNNYGVRPFAPFNEKWYSWDIVFIVDPIMLIVLLVGLLLPVLLGLVGDEIGSQKPQLRGRGGAIFALVCLAAVIGFRDFEHRRAVNALNARTYRGEDPVRVSAFPQPWNPFSWNGVVETRSFFHMLPVDSSSGEIDPQGIGVVRFKPEETTVTLAAKRSRLGQVFLDWAQYPFVIAERLEGSRFQVKFEDLRFESVEQYESHRGPPLAGFVMLDSQLRVEEMGLGRPPNAGGTK